MSARLCIVVLLAVALAGCSDQLEFADWTMPVPEGVRVVEYPFTTAEDRTESIALVEDLVLGLDAADPEQAFYRLRDVDVDDAGNLWVLDAGNHRVQVFDRDGDFIRSFGREGQGPGEFEAAAELAVVGDRVVVLAARSRLSLFDLRGDHVNDVILEDVDASLRDFFARDDGTFMTRYSEIDRTALQAGVSGEVDAVFDVVTLSLDGRQVGRQARMAWTSFVIFGGSGLRPAPLPRPFPSFAASSRGDVYVTDASEYQVFAFDPEGEPRWAMRIAHRPTELNDDLVEQALETARNRRPETSRGDLIWPDRLPALSHLSVDGHGHLYVYPYFRRGEELEERPVDVYSPDGELLFSGMILDRRWDNADGDYVFAAGSDRVTGELLVWRWRLEEPF